MEAAKKMEVLTDSYTVKQAAAEAAWKKAKAEIVETGDYLMSCFQLDALVETQAAAVVMARMVKILTFVKATKDEAGLEYVENAVAEQLMIGYGGTSTSNSQNALNAAEHAQWVKQFEVVRGFHRSE